MKTLLYLLCLLLSTPGFAAALGILALQHVIETRNPFKILYHILLAINWGVPLGVVGVLGIIAAGCFSYARVSAALLFGLLNFAAIGLVVLRVGAPRSLSDLILWVPTCLAPGGFAWIFSESLSHKAVLV